MLCIWKSHDNPFRILRGRIRLGLEQGLQLLVADSQFHAGMFVLKQTDGHENGRQHATHSYNYAEEPANPSVRHIQKDLSHLLTLIVDSTQTECCRVRWGSISLSDYGQRYMQWKLQTYKEKLHGKIFTAVSYLYLNNGSFETFWH